MLADSASRRSARAASSVLCARRAGSSARLRSGTLAYPATVNSAAEAQLALEAAAGLQASEAPRPAFTSEDFAFLLQARPGAYLWLGQGGERPLHHACYDFNDDALPHGVRWFCEVAESALVSRERHLLLHAGPVA